MPACVQVLPEGPPVDLKRRAQRSMQAQLGLPAAQVMVAAWPWLSCMHQLNEQLQLY